MAADEALLEEAEAGTPTLRLYGWAPATLSLGYFQRLDERATHSASQHCPVVRRASGGGAIVHDRELTYSFAVPKAIAPRPAELYGDFHATLAAALRTWGVAAKRFGDVTVDAPPGACGEVRGRAGEPFLCFARRSAEDLVAPVLRDDRDGSRSHARQSVGGPRSGEHGYGVKLAGSAQRRLRGALLQHGSILLAASPAAPELPGLAELGVQITASMLSETWLPLLAERLQLRWQPFEWTAKLRASTAAIAASKFALADWNAKR